VSALVADYENGRDYHYILSSLAFCLSRGVKALELADGIGDDPTTCEEYLSDHTL
jgi:hypothetical protein